MGLKKKTLRIIVTVASLIIIAIVILILSGSKHQPEMKKVILETNRGNITVNLYSQMPITAGNFEKLVSQGFYNGLIFHRVISGFMIQGGDPTGTGMGGPGYAISDEYTNTNLDKNLRGTIAMAKSSEPNSAGSQFFINLVDNDFLDGKYSVFGNVTSGMDVVDKIGQVQTDSNDRPLQNVTIIKAVLVN